MDNRVETDCGSREVGGLAGQGRVTGEKLGQQ